MRSLGVAWRGIFQSCLLTSWPSFSISNFRIICNDCCICVGDDGAHKAHMTFVDANADTPAASGFPEPRSTSSHISLLMDKITMETTPDHGSRGNQTAKQVSFLKTEEEDRLEEVHQCTNKIQTKPTTNNSTSSKTPNSITANSLMGSSWRGGEGSTSSGSGGSSSYSSSSNGAASQSIPSLGQRLIRTQKHRDPLRYYDIIKELGSGSMGSVCKVRKRTFGGSARQSFVEREKKAKRRGNCWQSWPCLLFCIPGRQANKKAKSSFVVIQQQQQQQQQHDTARSTTSSISNLSSVTTITTSERTKKQRQYAAHKQSSSMISYGSSVSVDFALKMIILDKCQNSTFRTELLHEIAILRSLDHPNIVRAVETYDYEAKLYLVLELCNGGDLYQRDPYTESQAKSIVYTLLDAIAYLHSKNITHRDLKVCTNLTIRY